MYKRLPLLILACYLLVYPVIGQDSQFLVQKKDTLTIAFGSCNKQDADQPLWKDIIAHQPDLFLFLGDNIYGDTEDMDVMKAKYERQKKQPDYEKLAKETKIIGVWDDHDYGKNDAGKEYSKKKESQQLFLDFFDVPEDSPLRERKGVYSSHIVQLDTHRIKIIMLDARYHRDAPIREDKEYQPNLTGTILGEEQWEWLEQELGDKEISMFIIASGIQFIPEDHIYEKWANFPNERKKLFDLLATKEVSGAILLSGDRHIAEISSIKWKDLPFPLVDFTASGLTHAYTGVPNEVNRHREGELIGALNYGVLNLSLDEHGELIINGEIRGEKQKLYLEKEISFSR